MFTSTNQLILHPGNANDSIEHQQLLKFLKHSGYIGETEKNHRFQVGEKFLSQTCFLGCSPNIELYPQNNNQPYCYIEVPPDSDMPQFVSGLNIKFPRCKHCKNELNKLPGVLAQNNNMLHSYHCPHCQNKLNPQQLSWRKTACLTRNQIIVNNIYESEAVPEQHFLLALQQLSGFAWKYCYIRLPKT